MEKTNKVEIQTLTKIKDQETNRIIGILINNKPYIETKYQTFEEFLPKIVEAYGQELIEKYNSQQTKTITLEEYNNQVTKNIKQKLEKEKLKNIKIHPKQINKCREDILSGKQITMQNSKYMIGKTMTAAQDVGIKKTNQEDSALILEHPQNKDFKILAISDGMGGRAAGELASNYILKELITWFESLNPELYKDLTKVQESLNNLLPNILKEKNIPLEAGATLSAVIIGKNNTLITNIGDSRIYTMKNGKMNQETHDDSYVYHMLDNNIIPHKELTRFHINSNQIENVISKEGLMKKPNYKIISNTKYDRIIAVSDGVSDCLSEQQLENIMKTSKPEYLSENIVETTLNTTSNIDEEINKLPLKEKVKAINKLKKDENMYYKIIHGGKDNTSAVSFSKK